MKSFNIVGETAQFLNVVYSSINSRTIDLVIQLFSTLNEFCSVSSLFTVLLFPLQYSIVKPVLSGHSKKTKQDLYDKW